MVGEPKVSTLFSLLSLSLLPFKVYTIDANDDDAIRRVVRNVLSSGNFSSFIPHEFTQEVPHALSVLSLFSTLFSFFI